MPKKKPQSVERRVHIVIASHFLPDSKITNDTHIFDDLMADSLDTVELVMGLEEEFGIEIPDDEARQVQTVGQAVSLIESAVQ